MRFTEYLDLESLSEAKKQVPGYQQPGDVVNMPHNFAKGKFETPRQAQASAKRKASDTATNSLQPFLQAAAKDRNVALELGQLINSMYSAKKSNPQVELTSPKLVANSANKQLMTGMFNLAKGLELPQLASISQQLRTAGTQGAAQAASGGAQQAVPTTMNQTQAQKTMLQRLLNLVKQAKGVLSPTEMGVAAREVEKAAKRARPNPPPKEQQPQIKPVATQG